MKIEKVQVINTKKRASGWRYPISVIRKMKQAIEATPINGRFGEFGFPQKHTVELESVAFTYDNPVIEKDTLYVDITVLDTPKGEELKEVIDFVSFVPVGLGSLNEKKEMEDSYEFISIAAINK